MAASSRDIYSDRSVLMAAGTLAAVGAWVAPMLTLSSVVAVCGLGGMGVWRIAMSPEAGSEESVRRVSRIALLLLTVVGGALIGLGGAIGAWTLSRMVSAIPSDLWGFLHELLLLGCAHSLVCYGAELLRSHVSGLYALCCDDAGRRAAIAKMVRGGASIGVGCHHLACALLIRSQEDDALAVKFYVDGLVDFAHNNPPKVVPPKLSLLTPAFLEKARAYWMDRVGRQGDLAHSLQRAAALEPLVDRLLATETTKGQLQVCQTIGGFFASCTEQSTELTEAMARWSELEGEAKRQISATNALLMAPPSAHLPPPRQRSAKEVALQVGECALGALLFIAGYQRAPYVTALSVLVGCLCANAERANEQLPASQVQRLSEEPLVAFHEGVRASSLSSWSHMIVDNLWPTLFSRGWPLRAALLVSNVFFVQRVNRWLIP